MPSAGREQAGKVGYNCLRTGAASGSKGPACYEPRWRSLRPHSASAALDRCYASAGRHMGAVVNQAQVSSADPSSDHCIFSWLLSSNFARENELPTSFHDWFLVQSHKTSASVHYTSLIVWNPARIASYKAQFMSCWWWDLARIWSIRFSYTSYAFLPFFDFFRASSVILIVCLCHG